jgi:riboflavin-specific deaminase-like protein
MSLFVFSNLAITLDGKIAPADKKYFALGTEADRKQMQCLRQEADVILMGASTLRSYKSPCLIAPGFLVSGRRQPANAILTQNPKTFSPTWPFFKSKLLNRVILSPQKPPRSLVQKIGAGTDWVPLKPSRLPGALAKQTVRYLEKMGFRSLLIEGGGETMFEFAAANLIDEFHVTLTPKILGGRDATTLVEGLGFTQKNLLNLKLVQHSIVGDEIFLVYRKTKKRGHQSVKS